MTKMIIGLLAVVLGVAGSALTAAPKKKQAASATGYVYVKCAGDGYRKIGASEYYPGYCDATAYTCAYVVTVTGASTVVNDWYSNADVANFSYGFDPKMRFAPNSMNEPYNGTYDEPIFE
jgi:hypothetical protein